MVFSGLFFLCVFLPVTLGIYYLVKSRTYRNWVLIIASLFFYAWGEPVWVSVLLLSTLFIYFISLLVEKYRGTWQGRFALTASITAELLILGCFKYTGFVFENINSLLGTDFRFLELGLPIGISFYTFKIISYIVDVYKGEVEAQKSPFKLLLYVSLFHNIMAGPIVRYKDIEDEIDNRVESKEAFNSGAGRFITGLGKKVLIANTAASISAAFLDTDYSRLPVLGAWFGIVLFALQLYFDFSGYSDMAIGLGRMFGFHYRENFEYPYSSKSVTEFWRRWHISLSSFFRDYVYIPLGGNRRHRLINMFVVWALTGLWHGASWNFIVWGLYYFVLLVIEKTLLKKLFDKIPTIFSRIYLWLAVLIGWVFFYHTDFSQALRFLGVMFGVNASSFSSPEVSIRFWNNVVFLVIALIGCTPVAAALYNRIGKHFRNGARILDDYAVPIIHIGVLVLSVIFLVGQSYSPPLYFKF